jgi:hypothetical protein
MNERELKRLFWSSLTSGHLKNNTIIPTADAAELRVVQEANFRSFDLLIAAIFPTEGRIQQPNGDLLARRRLLTHFARRERCSADRIRFYPVELKSDDDTIDERLPNQIIDAILTFGLSILVLDKNHSKKVRTSNLDRVLPATIVCYTGVDDHFEVVSVFDRFISCGIFDFERINLARLLTQNSGAASSKAYRRLELLQQILQKIIFSQLHFEHPGLSPQEQQFITALADISLPSQKKILADMIKETTNTKLTDYS